MSGVSYVCLCFMSMKNKKKEAMPPNRRWYSSCRPSCASLNTRDLTHMWSDSNNTLWTVSKCCFLWPTITVKLFPSWAKQMSRHTDSLHLVTAPHKTYVLVLMPGCHGNQKYRRIQLGGGGQLICYINDYFWFWHQIKIEESLRKVLCSGIL